MFVVETPDAKRLMKSYILMGVFLLALGSFGGLLTMHAYVKPRPVRRGVRLFGIALTRGG
jgi:hypothetical protein